MLTKQPAYYIFGANTDVGKTIFSASIAFIASKNNINIHYVKPIQSGYPEDNDAKFIKKINPENNVIITNIFLLPKALSAHRSIQFIENKSQNFSDNFLIDKLQETINNSERFSLIEGAGGIASPTAEGNLQCDIYRKINLPIIFVADSRLGGISITISSIELAKSRGFEIACILVFEGEHENHIYFKKHFENKIPVFVFKNLPKPPILSNFQESKLNEENSPYPAIYNFEDHLEIWIKAQSNEFLNVLNHILKCHKESLQKVNDYKKIAKDHIWWPFTQHNNIKDPQYIESAFGDYFQIANIEIEDKKNILTRKVYDASASWWTQNIGHASIPLAQAAVAAAGRYGHIMFPGNVHEPAVHLTQKLLNTVGKGWANRVFFSDNGSTANEIALKMAFRKSFGKEKRDKYPIILGLKDSYHGDTHATMDATEMNSFKISEHWYNPRGIWLNYPKIIFKDEQYFVKFNNQENNFKFKLSVKNVSEIFSNQRLESEVVPVYLNYIQSKLEIISKNNLEIGACILEGIIQGSGGMQFIDPVFQKLLIKECRSKKIPIILDEVFTAFWRLGSISAAHLLDVKPDIACFGKILTGGLIPMAVTLATEDIFNEFLGDDLSSALLHGHSYTAIPIGCAVAAAAIDEIKKCKNFDHTNNGLKNIWNQEYINAISKLNVVERVFSLGSIFVIELKDTQADYLSQSSKKIIDLLKKNNIDARSLGNVLYFIAGFNTEISDLNEIMDSIYKILQKLLMLS